VVGLTDNSGSLIEKYEYDVYGNTIIYDQTLTPISQSLVNNPYGFTGRRFDNETGLYYYRARYYSSELGRFLQTDPIGYFDDINPYIYCSNNPLYWVDPWGLCGEKATAPYDPLDITSIILSGTNYGGISKSGPGEPTSELDAGFKKHDDTIRESGASWRAFTNKDVRRAHIELIKDASNYGIKKTNNAIRNTANKIKEIFRKN